ncbi:MBL fold metallo-hydrolase [Clostridioides difficile]|uniref:MBL fold metallo-hydrolase n=1 Tax=Clostridioides difficile TaxID=1496 RepID=UPI001C1BC7BD|nr:MBL fold metallo-hydrolase [Clostridioides difficile]
MAKLTLEHIKGNTYYIPLPTIVGVYVDGKDAILIDSGNNKDTARQVLRLLEEHNLIPKLIINTHSNADHIGGNAYLKNQTKCKIATTKIEGYFTENPILESAFLYGGYPSKALKNKFLLAKESEVDYIIPPNGKIVDTELEAISLPGHYFEMIGVRTPDNVLFVADSLTPENIITKYHFFFLLDIDSQFKTLEKLRMLEADFFVPSHSVKTTDIKSLININKKKMEEIIDNIKKVCYEPVMIDEVIEKMCDLYNVKLDANQYVLVGSTIRSYITYLYENNMVEYIFDGGKMMIKVV